MILGLRASEWLPVILTAALFVLVVFGVDAIASRMWADLLGLLYLAAAPILYRSLRSAIPDSVTWWVPSAVRKRRPG